MISLSDISVSLDDTVVLDSLTMDIGKGRTTAIIGPSGCGKSTIMRLVTGLLYPDEGEVRVDGTAVTPETIADIRRILGYVVQDGGLFPHLRAGENVCVMARYLAWNSERIRDRLQELQELFHIQSNLLDRFPNELSGGQQQRICLMRAMMLDPEILLMDEPLGALDPMIRYKLQQDLKSVFLELGKTVLLVTHDMGEAGFLADDIILIRDGGIVQRGSMVELLHTPAEPFVEHFIQAQRQPWQEINDAG